MSVSIRSAEAPAAWAGSAPPSYPGLEAGTSRRRSGAGAFLLRVAACYLPVYVLCCGNVTLWRILPSAGPRLERGASLLLLEPTRWVALHLLHLSGPGVALARGASGDRLLDWLASGLLLGLATIAAAVWTLLDSRSPARDSRIGSALNLLLRLTLAAALLQYGWVKVFPLQMPAPSLGVLNEPLGSVAPMTLVWSLVGVSPVYEVCCGVAEVLAGLLVLFRRTQAAGALLTLVVMSQVMLYNLFLDVPLKLYTAHLLLLAAILLWPSRRPLANLLWRGGQPATGTVAPAALPLRDPVAFPRTERTVQAALLLVLCFVLPWQDGNTWRSQRAAALHPSPLTGVWRVDTREGARFPMPNGSPLADIILEPTGRVNLRSADGELWRSPPGLAVDGRTLTLAPYTGGQLPFAVTKTDAEHLLLTSLRDLVLHGSSGAGCPELHLTRVPLPAAYPLLERGFHWVNDWGYER